MTSFEVVSARVRERYSEAELARILIREASRRLEDMVSSDVIIVGAGPAGLTAAWLLAEKGFKVVVLERGLGVGGGLRGGGMLLPAFIIEEGEAIELARRAGIRLREAGEGIYVVDPIEFSAKLTSKAIDAGALIWVGVFVEDLVVRIEGDKVSVKGVVVNWAPVVEAGWHVDPLFLEAKAVVDATGHDAYLVRLLAKRFPHLGLSVPGMASLSAWKGEEMVVEKTGKILPGLYVAGMSVAETYNTPRMGPLASGMMVSGKKVAEIIARDLEEDVR